MILIQYFPLKFLIEYEIEHWIWNMFVVSLIFWRICIFIIVPLLRKDKHFSFLKEDCVFDSPNLSQITFLFTKTIFAPFSIRKNNIKLDRSNPNSNYTRNSLSCLRPSIFLKNRKLFVTTILFLTIFFLLLFPIQ